MEYVYANMNLEVEESAALTINGEVKGLEVNIYNYDYSDCESIFLDKDEVKELICALQHWVNNKPV